MKLSFIFYFNICKEGVFIQVFTKFGSADLKPKEKDIIYTDVKKEPFKIYGLTDENRDNFYRLPEAVARLTSDGVAARMKESAGVRVRFATDSPFVAIKADLEDFSPSPHISGLAGRGFDLYIEERGNFTYHNSFYPPLDIENKVMGITEFGNDKRKNIVINFPIGVSVKSLKIGIKKTCALFKAHEYGEKLPVVFFGASATQGFSASRPGNTYENFISRSLNIDYINMGFSACPLGEPALAEYFSNIPMSAFVMDYDFYTTDIEQLEMTYSLFYGKLREKNPTLPIILISKNDTSNSKEAQRRKKVVIDTYCNAVLANDNNIYYIDGNSLFIKRALFDCTVDGSDPNDLGMYFIGQRICKVLSNII